ARKIEFLNGIASIEIVPFFANEDGIGQAISDARDPLPPACDLRILHLEGAVEIVNIRRNVHLLANARTAHGITCRNAFLHDPVLVTWSIDVLRNGMRRAAEHLHERFARGYAPLCGRSPLAAIRAWHVDACIGEPRIGRGPVAVRTRRSWNAVVIVTAFR